MSLVLDLSHFQTVSSYPALADRVDGGFYIKTTESTYYTDSSWKTHHDGLAGEWRAPYHFMGQRGNFPAQVSAFINQYQQRDWEWGPVLDVEFNASVQSGEPTSADIRDWVAEWRRQSGLRFLYVYVGRSNLLGSCQPQYWIDSDMRIIGARYFADDYTNAFVNFGWDHPLLDIVQYWDHGNITGVSTVDVNNARKPLINSWHYGTEDIMGEPLAIKFNTNTGTTDTDIQKASAAFECFHGSALWNRAWLVCNSGWGTSSFKCYMASASGSLGVFTVNCSDSKSVVTPLPEGCTGLNIQYTGDIGSLPSASVFGDLKG